VIQNLGRIFMMIAVFIIAGHNMMPHHHYFEDQVASHQIAHHHHEHAHGHGHDQDRDQNQKSDHQSFFSYLQLDEDFLPAQFKHVKIPFSLSGVITPNLELKIIIDVRSFDTPKSCYHKFPPPEIYYSKLFSRPPPSELTA